MKISKHISIFLAILLLVSNMGFAFNVHYCGGSVASVSLKTNFTNDDAEADCCVSTAIKKGSSCCKDKVIKFEKKSENILAKSFDFQSNFDFLIQEYHPVVFIKNINFKSCKVTSYTCNANAPPIFKRNCQLLFYA